MSRLRPSPRRALTALAAALLSMGLSACDEDGKTAPERCADPPLPIYDIQRAGAPADDNERFPCVTPVGHAISPSAESSGGGTGGSSSGTPSTSGGLGGSPADAGAGGA